MAADDLLTQGAMAAVIVLFSSPEIFLHQHHTG